METVHVNSFAGWSALVAGFAGVFSLIFIILFSFRGQPFGTLNDIFNSLAAALNFVFAAAFSSVFRSEYPALAWIGLFFALAGLVTVAVGTYMVITKKTGWFLSGLFMSTGYALIGIWLVSVLFSVQMKNFFSLGVYAFGVACAALMLFGFLAVPGIIQRADSPESVHWYVNTLGQQANSFGWLVLYPIWLILAGIHIV